MSESGLRAEAAKPIALSAGKTVSSSPLIIACDWIPPAFGAVGRYEMLRAERISAAGRTVALIGFGDVAGEESRNDGRLIVRRIAVRPPDKASFVRRACWTLAMNLRLARATRRMADRLRRVAGGKQAVVEIKLTGSPPFFAYLYLVWNRLGRRDRTIYRMSDFYPETVIATGKAGWLRPVTPLFHRIRRMADRIDVLGEDQRRRLVDSGASRANIHLERDGSPVDFPPDLKPAAVPFGPEYLTLLYSGNLGVAHAPATFLEGYRRHVREGSNRGRLWVNGQGVRLPALQRFCADHDLPLHCSPLAPLEDLPAILLAADAHLVLLGDRFWGYVLPSKIYAAIESGRPVLYVGPAESDAELLCAADPRHQRVRNSDPDGVFAALERLSASIPARPRAVAE